jgi:hypothetical protein
VHVVSRIFQAHLQGVSHPYTSPQSATLPSLAELDHDSEAVDRWYVDRVVDTKSVPVIRAGVLDVSALVATTSRA